MARQFPWSACFKRWSTTNHLSLFENAPVRNITSSGLRCYRVEKATQQKNFQPSRFSKISQYALRLQVQNLKNVFTPKSYLHTSRRLRFLGDIMKVVLKSTDNVGKLSVGLLGRFGAQFSYLIIGGIVAGSGVTYFLFLNTVPFTGRNRLLLIKPEKAVIQGAKVAKLFENRFKPGELYPDENLQRVLQKILDANPSIDKLTPGVGWKIKVVKKSQKNAKSFPDGSIYIYEGLLKFATTDDQRAVILAHEMAIVACAHAVEMASHKTFREWMSVCGKNSKSCFSPEVKMADVATDIVFDHLLTVQDNEIHDLEVEKEANFVGLMFATKACYDPRAGVHLLNRLAKDEMEDVSKCMEDRTDEIAKGCDLVDMPDWSVKLFQYPERAKHLQELQPKAKQWRHGVCTEPLPPLPAKDQKTNTETAIKVEKLAATLKAMKLPKNDPRINMNPASGAVKSSPKIKA